MSRERPESVHILGEWVIDEGLRLIHKAYAAGLRMGRHTHDEPRFCLPLRGAYVDSWRGSERTRTSHHLSLHPAGEVHASEFLTAASCFHIEFAKHWRARLLEIARRADEPQEFLAGTPPVVASQLFSEFRRSDDCSPVVIEGLACELIGWCGRELREGRVGPSWLPRVRELLHDQFNEPLSIASLARTVAVHPVHLAREFKRTFGHTPGEYVRRLRVEYVCRRLDTKVDLAELASEAGFSDQSHLTRVFKRVMGTTPARFRAQR